MAENEIRPVNVKIVALNARYKAFYEMQSRLLEKRMADPTIREAALRDLASEECRQVQVYSRKPLELALQDAVISQKQFISQLAKAGQAKSAQGQTQPAQTQPAQAQPPQPGPSA